MAHNDAVHATAQQSGDFATESLFDDGSLSVSLLHFADDTHGVRLELVDRGVSMVMDTPAWLDLDTVLPEVSEIEPTLSVGYAIVERESADGETVYRLTVQGGDVVGRVSLIVVEREVAALRDALEASRAAVESADGLDHQSQPFGNGVS